MKQPWNYVAILIACVTLASISVPANGSNEEKRINALVKQAILLHSDSDDLTLRLEVIESLARELEVFESMYRPKAALRETRKLSEELGEIADELDDLVDAWNKLSNEASAVLPILQEMYESDSSDPLVEKGSEAFEVLDAVGHAIDYDLRPEIKEIGNKLRITTRSIEMRERLNQGSEPELAEWMLQEMEGERRSRAIESGLLDEYKTRIRQRIESNWQRPAGTREDLVWVVLLDILPGNEVNAITFEQFNGTVIDQRSIETAIRRSSPLPAPPVPELFERRLRLRYPASEPEVPMATGESLLEAVPLVRIDPQWPREALMDGTEGYVRCEVLIGPDGSVLDVRVIEAAPGRLFVRNAVRAVRRWKYKPHIEDGVAVERWVKTTLEFDLGS